jgi:1-acyl-sn-glycerol-3-phosphate acyltransferase
VLTPRLASEAPRPLPNQRGDQVLNLARGLATELYPERRETLTRLGVGASLETDFGFDSLSRAELLSRVESTFAISLPDAVLAQATTVSAIIGAVDATAAGGTNARTPFENLAWPHTSPGNTSETHPGFEAEVSPDIALGRTTGPDVFDRAAALEARTLVEVLDWHARTSPNRVHATFLDEHLNADNLTYGELERDARIIASGLGALGVEPGDKVALMLPSDRTYFTTFMGVLKAGATPVPIYPPMRPSQLESHMRRHVRILDNAQTSALITVSEGKLVSRVLSAHVPTLHSVLTPNQIESAGKAAPALGEVMPTSSSLALIQYTSGSTGDPKGVMLSHGELLANIRAMAKAIALDEDDVFVSWLPLYHDMGLIGAWLGSTLCFGARLVLMSPVTFLRRPASWLQAMHRFGGTLSAAPNFAYQMAVHRVEDVALDGLDLSRWRLAFNGAEPVSAGTMDAFIERFGALGFRAEAMMPVFGLAECSLGLTFPSLGRGPVVDYIDADIFERTRRAVPVVESSPSVDSSKAQRSVGIVSCGKALPGYAVRIADAHGVALPERNEGRIQFQGPSTTKGYYRNREATDALFHGPWLDSGDLGYLADADLHITRRAKDMIIRGGRNLFPYDLEDAVGNLEGVRKGCVAVFGSMYRARGSDAERDENRETDSERLIVLAEVPTGMSMPSAAPGQTDANHKSLREAVQTLATELLGVPADDVIFAPPNSVLKTSSGKIRRSACRESYENGDFLRRARPVWWQLGRLVIEAVPSQLARMAGAVTSRVWGLGAIATLALVVLAMYPFVTFAPRKQAWSIARAGMRFAARASGYSPEVYGLQSLSPRAPSEGGTVMVANHASYMDWIVVLAALPVQFGFVAKAELARTPLIGRMLRNLGTEFVDRFDTRQSVEDAARVGNAVRAGRTLMIFPEGTFRRSPGLAPFRLGAFQAAVQAQAPVVPICISGTRHMLPEGARVPRKGPLKITVLPSLAPTGVDWSAAIALRDDAREAIGAQLQEPILKFAVRP